MIEFDKGVLMVGWGWFGLWMDGIEFMEKGGYCLKDEKKNRDWGEGDCKLGRERRGVGQGEWVSWRGIGEGDRCREEK
jgi:hypothetical protein